MHVLILAAGTGSRLLPLTEFMPKPLLRLVDGSTILSRQLDAFASHGLVTGATIVTGHHADKVDAYLKTIEVGIPVATTFNPAFDLGGPLCSLWAVQDVIRGEDFIVINGDTSVSTDTLSALADGFVETNEGLHLAISTRAQRPDDMLVVLGNEREVVAVGKDLSPDDSWGVSAGLLVARGGVSRSTFAGSLEELLRQSAVARRSWPWHALLNLIIAQGTPIHGVEVPAASWREVDSVSDLSQIAGSQPAL